jgi:hypothetical protein
LEHENREIIDYIQAQDDTKIPTEYGKHNNSGAKVHKEPEGITVVPGALLFSQGYYDEGQEEAENSVYPYKLKQK